MTGVITSFPPVIEQPPGNNASNPAGLPGVTYTAAIPTLPQTWTALQTFTNGSMEFAGSTSGFTFLNATAIASGIITLPAATDTLVARNTTDTLTNKTLTSPAITTPTGIVKGDVGLGNVANVDTTNASNISSGTLPAGRLPNPTASTLGGVQSAVSVSHQWINSISTSGVPSATQPAFTDISGSVAATQMPALTGDVTTSAGTVATTIAANAVTNAKMATMAAWTFKTNNTSGSATPTDITIDGLTLKATPASTDEVILWDVAGGALKKATVSGIGSSSGVSSIAGNTGAFTLSTGLTNSTNDIRLALNNTTLQASPSNPSGTTAVTQVFMGLGTTCKLTPLYSGRIRIAFQGSASNTTASNVTTIQARYGTGTAPVNGASVSGTTASGSILIGQALGGLVIPFSVDGVITGLTPGTAYWFDLGVAASANTSTISSISFNAVEF